MKQGQTRAREMERREILWERLDTPGKDACRVLQLRDGWAIEGHAVFQQEATIACLSYRVTCASDWSTRLASVSGWVGSRDIDFNIRRSGNGTWMLNAKPVSGSKNLLDIDLGFTPATNTNALRRLKLDVGEATAMTALWLDPEDWSLKPLDQTYRRLSHTTYDYSSPTHEYRGELTTDEFGFVLAYPGLWATVRSGA